MLLEVDQVEAAYGHSQALFGMSLAIDAREVVTLVGRNGMGKTSTVRTVMGLLRAQSGSIRFDGHSTVDLSPHRIARAGIGLVPEGRHIFPNLSVRENLLMASADRHGARQRWTLDRVLATFPRLSERLRNAGNQLSGGEQQMLAIGRALMSNPKLLILDEATEGLAPLIREEIWTQLKALKETGLAMLVIDKEIDALCAFADRHYVVERGEVVWSGDSPELQQNADVQKKYFGV